MAANLVRSIAIITGRLRRNSTQGPSGTASTAPIAGPVAASAETATAPACITRIATSGKASNANQVPSVLTAYALQSQPNCRPNDRLRIEVREVGNGRQIWGVTAESAFDDRTAVARSASAAPW